MKCSFKNIRINALLFTAIMTLTVRGKPVEENEESRKYRDNVISDLSREWEYFEKSRGVKEIGPHRIVKKQLMFSDNGFERPVKFKAKLEPQIILQRKRGDFRRKSKHYFRTCRPLVFDRLKLIRSDREIDQGFTPNISISLNHFPREMSRRKEEDSVIRERNFRDDATRRRVAVPYMHNAGNGKRRTVRYRNYGYVPIEFEDEFENRRKWPFSPKWLTVPEPFENRVSYEDGEGSSREQYEPWCNTGRLFDVSPKNYMVQVEPGDDGDELEATCGDQQQFPLCNKYYYVFEKRPFKVKFLNLIPTTSNECMPQMMRPMCNTNAQNCQVKLSLPAFQCRPPECREVLYCKYFQCTSLGFFPDSRNCRKYFFCDLNSNGFVLYHMLCPRGRIFDPALRECRLRDMMEERSVRRCWVGAAKLKRDERMRIKKNLPETEEVIKYKEPSSVIEEDYRRLEENPKKVRRKSDDFLEFEGINARHGPKRFNSKVQFDGKETTIPPVVGCPCMNFSTQWIPIPVFPTVPRTCEPVPASTTPLPVLAFTPEKTTTPTTTPPTPPTRPKTIVLTKPAPTPTKPPLTTKTTVATTCPTTTCSTTTCATTTTTRPPMTTVKTTTQATTPVTNPVTKATLPICPPPPPKKKNHTCLSTKNLGQYPGERADNYQYEMQDEYGDDYYGAPDAQKETQESTYDWLKQSLNEYLDLLKKQAEKPETGNINVKTESNSEQSILPLLNGAPDTKTSSGNSEEKNKLLTLDFDRGKRSQNSTTAEVSPVSPELPDFEKCYNDQKPINLDGYPCKQYKRYPDKFDSTQYYECGAQPDGNMKIEHKRCPQGEVFSSEYLECIASEFMKLTLRKKRFPDPRTNGKITTTIEPEYNDENEKEIPSNEWIDANHPVKIPNEFKSKTKHNLRIFHLKCKRNLTEPDLGPEEKSQRHDVRSFEIRPNKKDTSEQLEDEDDEEYEDEEEYYDGEDEGLTESSTAKSHSGSSYSAESSSYSTTTSSKVLLDANIHVDREFENALKNILGKTEESEPNKDSILIRLSGEKSGERSKRNFIKDLFSKKSKDTGDDPDKEGVVSMLTLINGLPSQYERDALMQKLEKRKMLNSHIFRNGQRIINKKRRKRINDNKILRVEY